MNWNDGYCTEIPYTFGYYADFNPANIRFCLLLAGIQPAEINTACELGYGQGVSLNIHAAAEVINWYGTDFNPAQSVFAQEMAKASGAKVHCYAESFEEFSHNQAVPELDYICLHGIWSWVSPQVQRHILDFIDKKLKPGGVLYISYNTHPGWASFQPARDLMQQYAQSAHGGASIGKQVEQAFSFMDRLKEAGSAYFTQNPGAATRLEKLHHSAARYLAHELFNQFWQPCLFSDMSRLLTEARLTFACSAVPMQSLAGIGLNQAQKDILAQIDDPSLRQTVLDFIFNTQFRKDIWIKGPRPLTVPERNGLLLQEQFVLTAPPAALKQKVSSSIGEVTFNDASYAILINVLGDGKIHTVAEMEKAAQQLAQSDTPPAGIETVDIANLFQNLAVLQSAALAAPCQSKKARQAARQTSDNLNSYILKKARFTDEIGYVASPVLGGGIAISRFEQLFLLAMSEGAKTASDIARFTYATLKNIGLSVIHEGRTLDEQAAQGYLIEKVNDFINTKLPVYKTLQVN